MDNKDEMKAMENVRDVRTWRVFHKETMLLQGCYTAIFPQVAYIGPLKYPIRNVYDMDKYLGDLYDGDYFMSVIGDHQLIGTGGEYILSVIEEDTSQNRIYKVLIDVEMNTNTNNTVAIIITDDCDDPGAFLMVSGKSLITTKDYHDMNENVDLYIPLVNWDNAVEKDICFDNAKYSDLWYIMIDGNTREQIKKYLEKVIFKWNYGRMAQL
jgi:hypothetical protein